MAGYCRVSLNLTEPDIFKRENMKWDNGPNPRGHATVEAEIAKLRPDRRLSDAEVDG